MKGTDTLLYSVETGVATITLNRPDQLNAVTRQMLARLPDLLERAVTDGARAILLTGAGRAFCSGAALGGGNVDDERDLRAVVDNYYSPVARAFANSPLPIVTAVNGPAAGAGASLALWGDIIVAARSAYIVFAFSNIGLVPDAGASWLAAKSLGRVRAMELALLGERLGAQEAFAAGLITRIVEDEALSSTARGLAEQLASKPTLAMGLIRRQIHTALDDGLDATLAMEALHQGQAGFSEDFAEGVAAFRDKRNPLFQGTQRPAL